MTNNTDLPILPVDENIIGIAEFNECYGSPGLSGVIRRLVDRIKDMDAIAHERIHQYLYAATRQAPGGVNQQAIAAIENALLDIKGKAFNAPVYDLLGGAIRQEIPVYWSHCGTYLIRPEIAELCGVEPLQTIDDLIKLGRRVSDGGYTGLKTNMITFDQDGKIDLPFVGKEMGMSSRKISDTTKYDVDQQVKELVNFAYKRSYELITIYKDAFTEIVKELTNKRVISGMEISTIINKEEKEITIQGE